MYLEVTVPVGTFGLTRKRSVPAGTRVEFERVAAFCGPDDSTLVVSGPDAAAVGDVLREGPKVGDLTVVGEAPDAVVYRLTWRDAYPGIVADVLSAGGTVLSAAAADDTWTIELRFPDRDAASTFYAEYDDDAHPITIQRLDPAGVIRQSTVDGLTAGQREALQLALEWGYFEVPRRTSLVALAREMGISDAAVSQRLRRGLASVLSDVYTAQQPLLRREGSTK